MMHRSMLRALRCLRCLRSPRQCVIRYAKGTESYRYFHHQRKASLIQTKRLRERDDPMLGDALLPRKRRDLPNGSR